jgi:hypothetical protein
MTTQKTCGDNGGRCGDGSPCGRPVSGDARCHLHAVPTHDTDPDHVPTDQTRRFVETCIIGGIPEVEICDVLEISSRQLDSLYSEEIRKSKVRANAKVAQTAYQMATSGKDKTMTIFWLKARMGWNESGPEKTDYEKRRELLAEIDRRIEAAAEKTSEEFVFDD